MVCFFSFLFPPPLQPANKSLALSRGFSLSFCLLLAQAFSYKHSLFSPFNSRFFFLSLFFQLCPPPPLPHSFLACLPSSFPGQLFSSGSVRALEPSVSSSPSRQGSRGAHGSSLPHSLSLSPSHSLPLASLFTGWQGSSAVGGRGGAWQSRKLSFCCCVLLCCRPASPKSSSLSVSVCVRVAFPTSSLLPSHWFLFPPAFGVRSLLLS